jgi:putative ABC transport system substrate-binding protein
MDRRAFLGTLAGGLLAAPLAAEGQQGTRVPRVGYLSPLTASVDASRSEAFRQGLRELGYIEGRNIMVEYRFADGHLDRLPALAGELVGLNVDVIIAAGGGLIGRAVKGATGTIPIVMTNVEDPIASGLVVSLARPGRNVTGLSALIPELSAKRLEIVKEMVSTLSRVAVLWNSAYPEKATEFRQTQAAGKALGIRIQSLEAQSANEIDNALDAATRARVGALLILPDPLTNTYQARIVKLAAKRRLPTMFTQRPPVGAGGLMSYGASYADLFRRAATYVDKILKGAKPADLPVEQPTKFELVINLRTAKALGLTIPPSLLQRADEVIQ